MNSLSSSPSVLEIVIYEKHKDKRVVSVTIPEGDISVGTLMCTVLSEIGAFFPETGAVEYDMVLFLETMKSLYKSDLSSHLPEIPRKIYLVSFDLFTEQIECLTKLAEFVKDKPQYKHIHSQISKRLMSFSAQTITGICLFAHNTKNPTDNLVGDIIICTIRKAGTIQEGLEQDIIRLGCLAPDYASLYSCTLSAAIIETRVVTRLFSSDEHKKKAMLALMRYLYEQSEDGNNDNSDILDVVESQLPLKERLPRSIPRQKGSGRIAIIEETIEPN